MLKCESIWCDKLNIYNPYNDPWSEKLSKNIPIFDKQAFKKFQKYNFNFQIIRKLLKNLKHHNEEMLCIYTDNITASFPFKTRWFKIKSFVFNNETQDKDTHALFLIHCTITINFYILLCC